MRYRLVLLFWAGRGGITLRAGKIASFLVLVPCFWYVPSLDFSFEKTVVDTGRVTTTVFEVSLEKRGAKPSERSR